MPEGGVFLRIGQHLAQGIRCGDVHIQIEGRHRCWIVGVEEQRIHTVVELLPGKPAVRGSSHPITVGQMGGGTGPIGAEGIAEIIFTGSHHIGDPVGHLCRLGIHHGDVVAEFGGGLQEGVQLLVAFEIGAQSRHQLIRILGTLGQQFVDGNEGIGQDTQSVDQTATAVIGRTLMLYVPHIVAVGILAAHDQILRDGPAPVTHVEEHQEVLE